MKRTAWMAVVVVGLLLGSGPVTAEDGAPVDPKAFQGLAWRCIGPARGGRVDTVCGVRGDKHTYYMGACGGGVWKTTNSGHTWTNISDKFFKTGSVGAVVVAPSDPNVIYAGMGEPDPRGNFSHGDGVYRSTDAGKTWTHIGLDSIRQTGRIVVHPTNPDHVYVAALGHIWGPNRERGVYMSTDGGTTWTQSLYVDDKTGAIDIAIDPRNPRNVFAAFWQVGRKPYRLDSGGPGSGLYRSTDGGASWTRLEKGLPKTVLGRIGVSVSAAKPGRVFAMVEAEEGGLFRSDDGGDSWRRVNKERKLRQRAWYYSRVEADPQDADTVYVLNVRFHRSVDGGKTFQAVPTPHVDNHALWIDPDDNQRMIEGNDGGANVSHDGGTTWSRQDNQPTAQFYRVTTDNRFPYRVLGSQQDNSTMSIEHTSNERNGRDFHAVGGGEAGYIAVRPDNPDIVYGGSYAGWLTRYDHKTGLSRPISPWPENVIGGGAGELKHRFQWTFPIVISPHDPNVLYVGGEVLWKTVDGGERWTKLSGDLSTNDKAKQRSSGGPITQDNTTVEYFCTIFTVAESPLQKGRIWAGTDDGRVHVTDDEGGTWTEVTPKGLGEDALISLIEASPHNADTAYMAVNRYRSDDFTPYVYRTRDRGKTWTLVANGFGKDAFVRSIREDPVRPGLLYAGTETGMYVTFDACDSWQSLQLELPVVPVTDVAVKDDDLVIATQGRSFWILSGLSRLRQLQAGTPTGIDMTTPAPATLGLPRGAAIHFHVPEEIPAGMSVSVFDAEGTLVREVKLKAATDDEPAPKAERPRARRRRERQAGKPITVKPGWNVYTWDLRRDPPTKVPGAVGWPGLHGGPRVLPGDYKVLIGNEELSVSRSVAVRPDPRLGLTDADLAAAKAYQTEVFGALDRVHRTINKIRTVRKQITAALGRAKTAGVEGPFTKMGRELKKHLTAIEEALIQTKSESPQDPLNFPVRLNDKLTMLLNFTNRDPRPTQGMRDVLAHLRGQVAAQIQTFDKVVATDVPQFNKAVTDAKVPAVVVPDGSGK